VTPKADIAEIKKAYRQIALQVVLVVFFCVLLQVNLFRPLKRVSFAFICKCRCVGSLPLCLTSLSTPKKVHPDKCAHPDATTAFKKLGHAYQVNSWRKWVCQSVCLLFSPPHCWNTTLTHSTHTKHTHTTHTTHTHHAPRTPHTPHTHTLLHTLHHTLHRAHHPHRTHHTPHSPTHTHLHNTIHHTPTGLHCPSSRMQALSVERDVWQW
jgi:hypothetical protein